jgi:hypothetical protein
MRSISTAAVLLAVTYPTLLACWSSGNVISGWYPGSFKKIVRTSAIHHRRAGVESWRRDARDEGDKDESDKDERRGPAVSCHGCCSLCRWRGDTASCGRLSGGSGEDEREERNQVAELPPFPSPDQGLANEKKRGRNEGTGGDEGAKSMGIGQGAGRGDESSEGIARHSGGQESKRQRCDVDTAPQQISRGEARPSTRETAHGIHAGSVGSAGKEEAGIIAGGERERKKRASVLSNTVYIRGLPAFANQAWVAILIGRTSVAVDQTSGSDKIYLYRDAAGR